MLEYYTLSIVSKTKREEIARELRQDRLAAALDAQNQQRKVRKSSRIWASVADALAAVVAPLQPKPKRVKHVQPC